MIKQYLILFSFFLFLGGCAQHINSSKVLYPDWQARLDAEKNWRVQGKLAFIATDNRQSANLNWQQNQDLNHLVLTSFIGTRILSLRQTSLGATLDYDDQTYTGVNASLLLSQLTGFTIPLKNAQQWLKGIANVENSQYDKLGRATQLTWQADNGQQWQINYKQYRQEAGFWLPEKLTLKTPKMTIKIQLYDWQFN
ncbi:lipoprotein insertase outer membrane protein LolB [Pseudoalteromonas mariniglutinosa]|uniref:lipoprotein insertase outer membrane protein LolB n=1 Tax=Pseudoalteromonas mariniglutinosa TaxID=206042 RepID=UPI003850F001